MIQSWQPLFKQSICENVHVPSGNNGLAPFWTPGRPRANIGLPNNIYEIRDVAAEAILMHLHKLQGTTNATLLDVLDIASMGANLLSIGSPHIINIQLNTIPLQKYSLSCKQTYTTT